MTITLRKHEIPVAYSMIETVKRIRPRRDGGHLFQHYFLYWSAFSNIYTTIARKKGIRTQLKKNDDGSVMTIANGNVRIPQVAKVSERDQIALTVQEFDDDLKHTLIRHQGTEYFVYRIPYWQGKSIEFDALGQRVNGVLNIHCTCDRQYPVWSPIDIEHYKEYPAHPDEPENRDFLAGQITGLLFTVRNNLMHGSKEFDDSNDMKVIDNALSCSIYSGFDDFTSDS
jgi:hypothetical protein